MNRKSRFLLHKGTALGVGGMSAVFGVSAVQGAELSDMLSPDVLSSAVGSIGAYASIILCPALERIHPGDSYGKNFSYRKYLIKMMKTYQGFIVLGLAYAPIKYSAMKFANVYRMRFLGFSHSRYITATGVPFLIILHDQTSRSFR